MKKIDGTDLIKGYPFYDVVFVLVDESDRSDAENGLWKSSLVPISFFLFLHKMVVTIS